MRTVNVRRGATHLSRRVRAALPRPRSPLVISVQVRRGRINSEEWLGHAVEALRPVLGDVGVGFPRRVHVSVGFGGNTGRYERHVGAVCYDRWASADGMPHVFVSPALHRPLDLMIALGHECIHASDNCASGHRGHFARTARALGFQAPMTSSPPSPALADLLLDVHADLVAAHGHYPHAALDVWR